MSTPTPSRPDQWLQNAAALAMSTLLARLDLTQAARPFFWIDIRQQPPQASHAYWDNTDIAGRFVDGLVLARLMTAPRRPPQDGAEAEAMLRRFFFAQQDPDDGLFWNWEDTRPANAEMSKYVPDAGVLTVQRHVDMFCQRSPLLAMTTLLALGDESMQPRLQKMITGLRGIAQANGDTWRFPTYRWAPTLKSGWVQGEAAPEKWQGYRYALLTGLARYVQLTADPTAADLALGLARHYMRYGDVPPDGRYAANTHSGGVLPVAVGVARLGIWAGDQEMIDWAQRVYQWTRANTPAFGFLRDGLGLEGCFAHTCETCGLADFIHLALLLTEAGVGDYWDDIGRTARNQLLENQLRDTDTLRQLFPEIAEPVLAMMHGGFECAAFPNRLLTWTGVEGCCIGGGLRALYLTWRGAITEQGDESWVNLGFSRSTPSIEVIGHEPWQGRIDVRLHRSRRLRLRLPVPVTADRVTLLVDGRPVDATWQGRYAHLQPLQAGQVVTLLYPIAEFSQVETIGDQAYTGLWRGNTLVEIQPAGEGYPIYQRQSILAQSPFTDADLPWEAAPTSAAPPVLW